MIELGAARPEPAHREAFPHHSVWRGTYRCYQGLSAVTLTIDADPDGNAVARYDFGPVDSNPDVPVGAYDMTGRVHATTAGFTGTFQPGHWIEQPEKYVMVGLTVESAPHHRLVGTIDHATCSDFAAERVD